jgi:hypothetical protein
MSVADSFMYPLSQCLVGIVLGWVGVLIGRQDVLVRAAYVLASVFAASWCIPFMFGPPWLAAPFGAVLGMTLHCVFLKFQSKGITV